MVADSKARGAPVGQFLLFPGGGKASCGSDRAEGGGGRGGGCDGGRGSWEVLGAQAREAKDLVRS